MNEKVCPMISGNYGKSVKCLTDRCAWWCPAVDGQGGRCAMLDLVSVTAGCLYPYIKADGHPAASGQ